MRDGAEGLDVSNSNVTWVHAFAEGHSGNAVNDSCRHGLVALRAAAPRLRLISVPSLSLSQR